MNYFLCSPEILKNEPYGEKADVWAIGCILYELCTLRAPFYSTNMLQLATKASIWCHFYEFCFCS